MKNNIKDNENTAVSEPKTPETKQAMDDTNKTDTMPEKPKRASRKKKTAEPEPKAEPKSESDKLSDDNYYSDKMNKKYMSVSQFKSIAGTFGQPACEANALDRIEHPSYESSVSLLVGSYVDAYYEGTLDKFIATHPEIISSRGPTKGQLKAEYKQAETIIERTKRDALFQKYMSGKKQEIMTAELFGVPWKIKMDSYFPGDKIVDLKIVKSIRETFWVPGYDRRMDFIRYWGYDIQGAVYQKIVELATGKKLPFYIAAASKEKVTDIEIINVSQPFLDEALSFVEMRLKHVMKLKNHEIEPCRCGLCSYCRETKKLIAPLSMESFTGEVTNIQDIGDIDTSNLFGDADDNPFAENPFE